MGLPPIAYTSLSELQAAMRPKVYGSSTDGVNTSTVCTRQRSGEIRKTPASSAVALPTSRRGSVIAGSRESTRARSAGGILEAHPAFFTRRVSRGAPAADCAPSSRSPAEEQTSFSTSRSQGQDLRGSQMQCPSFCERAITRARLELTAIFISSYPRYAAEALSPARADEPPAAEEACSGDALRRQQRRPERAGELRFRRGGDRVS